jgi:predicted nucleic acid-binding protein
VSRFVLDASVALRWFLNDPVPEYAAQVRRRILDGYRAVVSIIWTLEMVNSLVVAERRGNITPAAVDERIWNIEELLDGYVDVQGESITARNALSAARISGLTAYDASYLDLAQTEKLPLATLDAQLRKAAERAGVEVIR